MSLFYCGDSVQGHYRCRPKDEYVRHRIVRVVRSVGCVERRILRVVIIALYRLLTKKQETHHHP